MGISLLTDVQIATANGTHDWMGRPCAIKTHTGRVIVPYRSGAAHAHATDDVIHLRYSDDDGATWSDEDKLPNASSITGAPFTRQNVGVGVEACDGIETSTNKIVLYVFERNETTPVQYGPYCIVSTDDGVSWTNLGKVTGLDTEVDKTMITGVRELSGTLYLCGWVSANGGDHAGTHKSCWYTATLANPEALTKVCDIAAAGTAVTNTNEWFATYVASQSKWLGIFRNYDGTKTYKRWSVDATGATWAAQADITDQIHTTVGQPQLYQFGSEQLLIAGRHTVGTPPAGRMQLWYSKDLGATWAPVPVQATVTNDGGYGQVWQRADGDFYGVYYSGTTTAADIRGFKFSCKQSIAA